LSHDLVLLDTTRLDSKGDYQDRAKAEASVIVILNVFNALQAERQKEGQETYLTTYL
jgi:hypothetical protein